MDDLIVRLRAAAKAWVQARSDVTFAYTGDIIFQDEINEANKECDAAEAAFNAALEQVAAALRATGGPNANP